MEAFLQLNDITKRFPGVLALDGVSLRIRRGEVHALLGENGAGKSTLMSILAGVQTPDCGEIVLDGKPVNFQSPREALAHGIAMIFQELSAVPDMTVAENVFLGREPLRRLLHTVDRVKMRVDTTRLCEGIGVWLDPDARMSSLTLAEMQMVEIIKALAYDSDLLIMDEPTSALEEREVEKLFGVIRQLTSRNQAVVYISHKMNEIEQIANCVTVLRDGRYVDTRPIAGHTRASMISLMVGRDIRQIFPREAVPAGDVRLAVSGLCRSGEIADISFEVRAGEILGVAGLMGAGRTELVETLFGLQPATAGSVVVNGQAVTIRSPHEAIELGLALLSEDRKLSELNLKGSVLENMTLANLGDFCRMGQVIAGRREKGAVDGQIGALRIKTPSRDTLVATLSGGNQQKVVLSRRLLCRPDVLMLDEPTRGIDVGAKAEIYGLMNELTRQGKAIIMVSSELPEVMGMSDRIIVLHEGRITGEFVRPEFSQERIMACATGQVQGAVHR